jgi:hypothetical protein
MANTWRSISGVSLSRRFAHGIHIGNNAFRRIDHGYPEAAQIASRADTTRLEYVGRRRRRRFGTFPGSGPFRRRKAYFR